MIVFSKDILLSELIGVAFLAIIHGNQAVGIEIEWNDLEIHVALDQIIN